MFGCSMPAPSTCDALIFIIFILQKKSPKLLEASVILQMAVAGLRNFSWYICANLGQLVSSQQALWCGVDKLGVWVITREIVPNEADCMCKYEGV